MTERYEIAEHRGDTTTDATAGTLADWLVEHARRYGYVFPEQEAAMREQVGAGLPSMLPEGPGYRADEPAGLAVADWTVRVFAPAWLALAGLGGHAASLAGAAEITDRRSAEAVVDVARLAASAAASATRVDDRPAQDGWEARLLAIPAARAAALAAAWAAGVHPFVPGWGRETVDRVWDDARGVIREAERALPHRLTVALRPTADALRGTVTALFGRLRELDEATGEAAG